MTSNAVPSSRPLGSSLRDAYERNLLREHSGANLQKFVLYCWTCPNFGAHTVKVTLQRCCAIIDTRYLLDTFAVLPTIR